jgi:hypothetical protein
MGTEALQVGGELRRSRKGLWSLILVLLVICVGVSGVIVARLYSESQQNKQQQDQLMSSLQASTQDSRATIDTATQLLNGVKSSKFKLSSAQLANVYMLRSSAYLTLGQYAAANSDAVNLVKEQPSLLLAALQIEFPARYALGERQQLIPLLQQLIALKRKTTDPMTESAVQQWQADIQAIKTGQEVQL